jgi:CRISPR-associated protein Cmr1
MGTFILKIQSLHPDFKPEIIGGLIQFIADWAALGARPQMGFGVIQVEGNRIDTQTLYDWLITTVGSHTYPDLPSLQNIFLAKIQSKDSSQSFTEVDTFNLKYNLRTLFRPKDGKSDNLKSLRHFIMGAAPDDKKGSKAEDDRQAAKIKISRPCKDKHGNEYIHVWGWIPTEAEVYKNGWDRKRIVDTIYEHLKANYTLHNWREMNSERDTVTANQTNIQAFLHGLLRVKDCDGVGQP